MASIREIIGRSDRRACSFINFDQIRLNEDGYGVHPTTQRNPKVLEKAFGQDLEDFEPRIWRIWLRIVLNSSATWWTWWGSCLKLGTFKLNLKLIGSGPSYQESPSQDIRHLTLPSSLKPPDRPDEVGLIGPFGSTFGYGLGLGWTLSRHLTLRQQLWASDWETILFIQPFIHLKCQKRSWIPRGQELNTIPSLMYIYCFQFLIWLPELL